jgi:hypothetical protein
MSDCGAVLRAATLPGMPTTPNDANHAQGGAPPMKRSHRLFALSGLVLTLAATLPVVASAKHGKDDPVGHVRHGGDDGPRHVRHGGDDGPRHR